MKPNRPSRPVPSRAVESVASAAWCDDAPTDRFPALKKKSWFRTATGKAVSATGAIVLAAVTTVVTTSVNKQVYPDPKPPKPSAAVNHTNPDSHDGPGWSVDGLPTEMSGDFLTLTASMRPGRSCTTPGEGWVFSERAEAVEPLSWAATTEEESDWAERNDGVPASGNYIIVNVQSRSGQPVIIESIGVRVVKRSAPITGALARPTSQCGGMKPSLFEVDLDKGSDVEARPISGGVGYGPDGPVEVPPVPLPHRLDDTDPSEQWQIALRTNECDCLAVAYFRYTSNGQSATVDITNRGGPWRVTAQTAAAPACHSNSGEWRTRTDAYC